MHHRARAIALALTTASLLAGTVVTAAPAFAASSPSLTAAYCAAQANGNVYQYTQAKGMKTCTITYPAQLFNDGADHTQTRTAPYGLNPELPAAAYQGDYSTATYWTSSKVLTQKGGQAINTAIPADTKGATVITAETCQSGSVDSAGNFVASANTYTAFCDDLGMYPNLAHVGF